jgi:polygalacturonase
VVYLPPGVYRSGGVQLKTNVTLHLEAGAYLWGAEKRELYVHPRGHLVFAEGADTVAVRGRGTIYGNAHELMAYPPKGAPHANVLMPKGEWRAERCLCFERCTNLLLEDVTVRHTPEWAVHVRRCDRVRISGLSVINGITSRVDRVANGDGLDIDTCSNVRVSDCFVQSGDDAICLKIDEFDPDKPAVCRDVVVTNCVARTTQTALKLGTGSCGEYRNIVFSDCTVLDGAGGIGLWMRDGGLIDGVRFDNIVISQSGDREHGTAIFFRGFRRSEDTPRDGLIRNVSISNVTASSHGALYMAGPEAKVFQGIEFRNIRFNIHGKCPRENAVKPPVPDAPYGMNDRPYEIYVYEARDLTFQNVTVRWDEDPNPQWSHAMRLVNVQGVTLDGFAARQGGGNAPAVLFQNVQDAVLRHCAADQGTGTFLRLEGPCRNIRLSDNDLSRAQTAVARGAGAENVEIRKDA